VPPTARGFLVAFWSALALWNLSRVRQARTGRDCTGSVKSKRLEKVTPGKFDSFFFFARDEFVSVNDARTGVPSQNRIVVTRRAERLRGSNQCIARVEDRKPESGSLACAGRSFVFARRSATNPE